MILISQNKSGGSAALTQSRTKASERAFSAVADNGDTHRKEFGYGKRKRLKFRYDKMKSYMQLWENTTLIFSGAQEGLALAIESPLITGLYSDLFDLLW